jgi:iron complex outermembrane receptor protein
MTKSTKLMLLATSALFAFSATSAIAQTETASAGEARAIETVVVTARKTAENLQTIPLAVTAVTAEQIERQSIQGLTDVARYTPGFSFEDLSGPFAIPSIRGQTQTRVDLPVQNVATFFNGVYLQRGYMVDAALLDVERIEVVKGPQSALYGRNAFSGAINFITARPSNEVKAKGSFTLGSDKRRDFSGAVSGPLIEGKLAGMLAIAKTSFDGTWDNVHALANSDYYTDGKLGGYNNESFLGGLTFTPTDYLTFDFAYSQTKLDEEVRAQYTLSTAGLTAAVNSLNCSPVSGGVGQPALNRLYCGEIPADPVIMPGENRKKGFYGDPRTYTQRGINKVLSFNAGWDITDNLAVKYLFGKTESNVNSRGSPARNPEISANQFVAPIIGLIGYDSQPNGNVESDQHDLRVEWTPKNIVRRALVGAFHSTSTDNASSWSMWSRPLSLEEPLFTFTFGNTTREDSVDAFYGLITFDFTDKLSMTAEARHTKEEITLKSRATSPGFIATPLDSTAAIIRTQVKEFSYTTPRVSVDYQLTADNLIYGSIAKGVKTGGINVPGLDPNQDFYQPEENWTYEIGSKNQFFDNKLRLNVAAFYIDWTGIQGSVARNYPTSGRTLGVNCFAACSIPALGTPVPVIVGNLADAKVKGIEIDGIWLATDNITVNYAASYVNAEYNGGQISQRAANARNCDGIVCATSVFNAIGQAIDGARIGGNAVERTPSIKLALGAQYDGRIESMNADWFARIDGTYQDKQYVDELNLAWVPARTLFDASIGLTKDNYSIRAWGKNLLDEKYVSGSFFLIGTDGARSASYVPFVGERRSVGITFSLKN